ncbi:hypothetical protein C7H19_21550 [Aphanothece hegewaldii CCALA 016]|uniref:Uncharacterized protein n=1 Tax=Aphanothece hegewaldii CCALA 016 TaxID=2107694 RepID=A0A2T1LS95_9CHRO|nr:hypothetical protein [Aphanothece hegewaldii]PSF32483.1 hypothetical protein C7H19_21550 [Aphanothece hegewaldii CCALA 016]
MAFYITLTKESEDEQGVIYQYESAPEYLGKIYFDKSHGTIKKIQSIPEHLLVRAEIKLRQHWQKGHFPDKTCWAS